MIIPGIGASSFVPPSTGAAGLGAAAAGAAAAAAGLGAAAGAGLGAAAGAIPVIIGVPPIDSTSTEN